MQQCRESLPGCASREVVRQLGDLHRRAHARVCQIRALSTLGPQPGLVLISGMQARVEPRCHGRAHRALLPVLSLLYGAHEGSVSAAPKAPSLCTATRLQECLSLPSLRRGLVSCLEEPGVVLPSGQVRGEAGGAWVGCVRCRNGLASC